MALKVSQIYILFGLILPIGVFSKPQNGGEAMMSEQARAGLNEFALSLQPLLCQEDNLNCVYSPYSIYHALGLMLAGAQGTNFEQIQSVLGLDQLELEEIDNQYKTIIESVHMSQDGSKLFLANRFYGSQDVPFYESFLQRLQQFYNADAINLDFQGQPEASRSNINAWVEESTNNLIKDLLPSGSIDSLTVAVLVNALYFKGVWDNKFDVRGTKKLNFTTGDGSVKLVDTMRHVEQRFVVGELPDLQSSFIKIPYHGQEASMYVVIPKLLEQSSEQANQEADITKLLGQFNSNHLETVFNWGEFAFVNLYLPKFDVEYETQLASVLQSLGMVDAFDQWKANFRGMVDLDLMDQNLYVSEGYHKTKVVVDEEGTEAASGTAMVIAFRSFRLSITFKVDVPFLFFVVHEPTKAILFTGVINDPQ
eukprot:TRINITY_DN7034_c1_g4_i1.p1 TRINITY_DN7034_c1_g4~~TRINITY_DN7034_c1_g4_i1.p1  ORF type:complete len:479 (-),score=47.50 TRINITY_DN7034_c1_g4_i1:1439-2707(-)